MFDINDAEIVFSSRRTMAIEIRPGGKVIVKAPYRTGRDRLQAFVNEHEDWINKHLEKQKRAEEKMGGCRLNEADIKALAASAKRVIPERVAFYAEKLGVTYGRITIRNQVTRWGSCSSKGNLNFNCLLMMTPPEVLDSVVVHELCHRLEMNHSKKFYEHVLSVYPDYPKWNKWLKDNGDAIMKRMTG